MNPKSRKMLMIELYTAKIPFYSAKVDDNFREFRHFNKHTKHKSLVKDAVNWLRFNRKTIKSNLVVFRGKKLCSPHLHDYVSGQR